MGPQASISYVTDIVSFEQGFSRQRLRPGSGFLNVQVITDGPTRVLQIYDANKQKKSSFVRNDQEWHFMNKENKSTLNKQNELEFQVIIVIKFGIGISLVNAHPAEELCYVMLNNVLVDYTSSRNMKIFDGSVQNIQIDNQLYDCQCPIILYLSPSNKSDEYRHMPAIHFTVAKTSKNGIENAEIFKHAMITVKNLTLNLEEEFICKFLKWLGMTAEEDDEKDEDVNLCFMIPKSICNTNATRYYFGTLKLNLNQVKLSVIKNNKLDNDLKSVKRKMNLSLITFEDANIELDPFIKIHPFETIEFLTNSVKQHYRDELLSQAVLILGSTDFLGNPLGFINDISEGVSGLVSDGNVGGLIKNVAHGAANSAAKVNKINLLC